jgi:propanediol dehydratase small subunit
MAVKVMEPFRSLSREELLNKVYELGAAYEKNSYSCS